MGGTIFSCLRHITKRLARDQRGNALFLTAAALVPIVGIVGSGIDIGRAYMTQLRLQQSCDAGVLAGRRAMAAGTYSDTAKAEANKMFDFNMPTGIYGSKDIAFSSQAPSSADVSGTASAKLPTAIMYIFGTDQFNLSVACTAKLEISNVDVMLVLDVTGSMARANGSDSVTKIAGLRKAAIDFFDTLTKADIGDGQLRFGVVPYSSTVNVGQILLAGNAEWLDDNVRLPSRSPKIRITYDTETEEGDAYVDGPKTEVFNKDMGKCDGSVPVNTQPTAGNNPNATQTGQYVDDEGNQITTYDVARTYSYYNFRTNSTDNKCRLERWKISFARTNVRTVTVTPVRNFDGKYTYQDRDFPVGPLKTGNVVEADIGDWGTNISLTWNGCIIERFTTAFASDKTAPKEALDMNIDMVPTTDVDTKWKMFIANAAFNRGGKSDVTTSDDKDSAAELGGDYAACPMAAMKLTKMTKADKAKFEKYINDLQPKGYTYHDAGMAWGARLISPTGLFANENATATNNRPISRHIVFMTDGDMTAPRANLSHQGQERSLPRIGATSDDDAVARHNNRFVQLCRQTRDKGITIWVVSFGVGTNTQLNSCATSGIAYESDDSEELNDNFQSIARQISKLRLSQ